MIFLRSITFTKAKISLSIINFALHLYFILKSPNVLRKLRDRNDHAWKRTNQKFEPLGSDETD